MALTFTEPQVEDVLQSGFDDIVQSVADLRALEPLNDRIRVVGTADYVWEEGNRTLALERSSGTASSTAQGQLTDSSATFVSDGVVVGDIVNNTTTGTTTTVSNVDSQTLLTLSSDIFTSGQSYSIGHANLGIYVSSAFDTYGPGEANEGRWIAQVDGAANISIWEPNADGSDDHDALQEAFSAWDHIFIPKGSTYTTLSPILVSDKRDTTVEGGGTIKAGAAMDAVLKKKDNYISSPKTIGKSRAPQAFKLNGLAVNFIADGVAIGDIVNNISKGTCSTVTNIDSSFLLSIAEDIFPDNGDFFEVGAAGARPRVDLGPITVDANNLADHAVWVGRSDGNRWNGTELQNALVSNLRLETICGTEEGSIDGVYSGLSVDGGVGEKTGAVESSADNGSGLIRVTSTAHGLTTGDFVNVLDLDANTGGRYSVTVDTANTFDLDGSTFSSPDSTGTWHKRADRGIHISTGALRNRFASSTVDRAGLYSIDVQADDTIVRDCTFSGGAQYGINAGLSALVTSPVFDTLRYGARIDADDVSILSGVFGRSAGNDPGTMTAVQLSSGTTVNRLEVMGGRIEASVSDDIDLNGGSLVDRVWYIKSQATTFSQFYAWPPAQAPQVVDVMGLAGALARFTWCNGPEFRWTLEKDTTAEGAGAISGTTTATTAGKLEDSGATFVTSGVAVGDAVFNTTDSTETWVTAVDSETVLSLNDDIFTSGEGYTVQDNTGQDLVLYGYNDHGTNPVEVMRVARSSAPSFTWASPVTFDGATTLSGRTVLESVTMADGDATPDVSLSTMFVTANTGSTTITNFDGPTAHQVIFINVADVNTTIQNNANIVTRSGSDITTPGVYHFAYRPSASRWEEIK
ncbi:MAG: hypothetical protein R3268_00090 [Acidiferrobacterales bacterium]|nr:hypothetical protein [Acidiferrobacterales bacterium]